MCIRDRVNGVSGNRALRFCPTVTLTLETANPDLGIGSDVRMYPAFAKTDSEKRYDHRIGVNFIHATAQELANYTPTSPLPTADYTSTEYNKIPVLIKNEVIGTVSVSIKKENLDGTTINNDVLTEKDIGSDRTKKQY